LALSRGNGALQRRDAQCWIEKRKREFSVVLHRF
jgi:hypothetical protein